MQNLRNEVDRRSVRTGDDGRALDVTHESDLRLDALANWTLGSTHDGVGLDADLT